MPIRINLLAESQAAEESRRKDPVKRGLWVCGFLVSLVLIWVLKLECDIWFDQKDLARINTRWTEIKANYGAVTNNEIKTKEIDRKLAQLDSLSTNRFLWAPVLNALQKSVINNVQVLRLRGEQVYTVEAPHDIGTGAAKRTIPGGVAERTSLFIDAKDADAGQENYTRFKEALCNSEFFVKSLGRRDGFVFEGTLSAPSADPGDPGHSFVTFEVASHFPEVRR
jgi:hypothetical protein